MAGNNWRLHWFWPITLKYITAPAVGLVFTFAYPKFLDEDPETRYFENPAYIYGFSIMHLVIIFVVALFVFPRFFNFLIPEIRRGQGRYDVEPQVTIGQTPVISEMSLENGKVEGSQTIDGVPEITTDEPGFISEKRR